MGKGTGKGGSVGKTATAQVGLSQRNTKDVKSTTSTDQEMWVKVDDRVYDVQSFARKHPGGSVLKYTLHKDGADGSNAFEEFHFRSKKAKLMLKALPNKPASEMPIEEKNDAAMLEDFARFRADMVAQGFFEPKPMHVAYRIVEVTAMFAAAIWLLSVGYFWTGLTLIGLFGGRCGWIQHEGGHNSLTGNMKVDKAIQTFFIGFGLSSSGAMWNAMHQKHHATPQKIKHDLDIDTVPLVAFFNTALLTAKTPHHSRLWFKFQALTFIPVTSGIIVMLFWLFYLHPRKVIREMRVSEGVCMLASHIVTTHLIMQTTGMGLGSSYAAFWYTRWIAGMYLFGNFSLSHTHCDTVGENEQRNWVEFAVHHTVDIVPGDAFVDWWMGYLNCQVIHHLFPSMPQVNQPIVSKLFEPFCKKWGLKYQNVTYVEALRLTFMNLWNVGQHIDAHDHKH
jgi:fatty acid desaturase